MERSTTAMNARDHHANAAASQRRYAMSAKNQPGTADAPKKNGVMLANNQLGTANAPPRSNGAVLANNQPGSAHAPRRTGAMFVKNQDGNVNADAESKVLTALTPTLMTAANKDSISVSQSSIVDATNSQTGDADARKSSISATYVKNHLATASTNATNATSQNTFANASENFLS